MDPGLLPEVAGKVPQGAVGVALSAWALLLSHFLVLRLWAAAPQTHSRKAVSRLGYFIQENLAWQSDSHSGAAGSMSSLGPPPFLCP